MKIALAQMICKCGDIEANLATIQRLAQQAKSSGAEAIVLPEMVDTGYHMPTILQSAAPADGRPRRYLSALARDLKLWIIAGLSLREGEQVFNTAVAFDPAGAIAAQYRKVHLFSGEPVRENGYLAAGDALEVFDLAGIPAGLMICYDLRFPELSRSHMLAGAQVLIVCSAWPSPRIFHWSALLVARAIENQCYVLAANRAGNDHGQEMGGCSMGVDPVGLELCRAEMSQERLLLAEVASSRIAEIRTASPALRDRRPGVYRA